MFPAVAADSDGGVHAFWLHASAPYQDLMHRWLAGTQWSAGQYLTEASRITEYAVATDDSGNVHVVWRSQPSGPNEISYLRWDGQGWGPQEQVATSSASLGELALAVDGEGRVHVVWIQVQLFGRELRYRQRDAMGWSSEVALNPAHTTAWSPVIGADRGGRVHVVWEDARLGETNLYALHCQAGQWTMEERLTRLPTLSSPLEASLVIDAKGTAHLAWSDDRNEHRDVYYRRWSPETGWSLHERVTVDSGDAQSPALSVDRSGTVHLVWCDDREGNREIYSMQRPPDGPWEPVNPDTGGGPSVRCYPNPFKAATGIHAHLPAAGPWAVRIFDLQGRLVYTYRTTASQAGPLTLDWVGQTDDDQTLSRGPYFVHVSGHGQAASARVILISP